MTATRKTLDLDLASLTFGEITTLEMTLNDKLRDLLPTGTIVTFDDVQDQFRARRSDEFKPDVKIPLGLILQTLGLLQLRQTDPNATWEDTADMVISADDVAVPDPKADPLAQATTYESSTDRDLATVREAVDPVNRAVPLSPPTAPSTPEPSLHTPSDD